MSKKELEDLGKNLRSTVLHVDEFAFYPERPTEGKMSKSVKEIIKAQVESISKPRPGESQQDFLKRKGVIK
jgi:hypothetical protein